MRTTNKIVVNKLKEYVLENFQPENYEGTPLAIANLVNQIDYMRYNNRSIYQTALDYVEGGSYLVYYGDVREFVKELLEQTDEEANKYSDDKVWRLYCHLIARTMSQLYTERQNQLKKEWEQSV